MPKPETLTSKKKHPTDDHAVGVVEWRKRIHRSHKLRASDKLLAYTLANYMDEDGYCFPSQSELASASRLSRNTIGTASVRLIAAGYLKRRKTRRQGAWPQYRYWARVPGDQGERREREQDEWFAAGADVFG